MLADEEKNDRCIDANRVVAWFDGELSVDERRTMDDHVERCDACRALLVEMGRDVGVAAEAVDGAVEAGVSPVLVGERIGRYVVTEWLGAGGMGVVYGAFDPELDRNVALKVVRAGHGADEQKAQLRLLEEAQKLARISHPNVIAVFDAGTHEHQVFLAMEQMAGGTLADWLAAEKRTGEEIVARFVEAGRGLAAAHARKIIHRDFKPTNVLLGSHDRTCVTDFGLASIDDDAPTSAGEPSLAGTPGYMSPEQRARDPLDARSDQYSFCASLHEALFGALPGEDAKGRATPGAPARVRGALARGLSVAPNDRFATMDDLLAELGTERSTLWRRVISAVAVLVGLLALVAWYDRARAARAGLCTDAAAGLNGVWDAPRRDAVATAFGATGVVYAGDALRRVDRALDDWAAQWTAMHEDACRATRIRGDQSEEAMDLRMACLSAQAREVAATTDLLAKADAKTVEKAVPALYALPNVTACADVAKLRSRSKPPLDPEHPAKLEELQRETDRARSLGRLARYKEALDLAVPLVDRAKEAGDDSLVSDVEYVVGRARLRLGDNAGADAALDEAVAAAERAHDDVAEARALVELTYDFGEHEAKYDEADRAGSLAAAVLTHVPSEIQLQAELEEYRGFVDDHRGNYERGNARTENAIAMLEKAFGPDDYRVGMALNNASKSVFLLGDIEKALGYQERAATIIEKTLGSHHPDLALALSNAALSEDSLKHTDDAIRDVTRALVIWRSALGPEHAYVGRGEGMLAMMLKDQGRLAEAMPHAETSLALLRKAHPNDHPDVVNALVTLGQIYVGLGRTADAVSRSAEAVAICHRLGDPPNETGEAFNDLGAAELANGDAAKAVDALERALVFRVGPGDKEELAETRFELAKALTTRGGDAARARSLAEQARAGYASQKGYEAEAAAVGAWLEGSR